MIPPIGGRVCVEVTFVVLGEYDTPALLGGDVLKGLAPAIAPTSQQLVPTHLIMY